MPSGLPDWKLSLNIIGQEDGYLKQRPSYGAATLAQGAVAAPSMVYKNLVTVTGIGVIYGGRIYVVNEANHLNDNPIVTVDGNAMGGVDFQGYYEYQHIDRYQHIMHCLQYDLLQGRFAVGILPGVTFEESFQLGYVNEEVDEPTVYWFMVYALI